MSTPETSVEKKSDPAVAPTVASDAVAPAVAEPAAAQPKKKKNNNNKKKKAAAAAAAASASASAPSSSASASSASSASASSAVPAVTVVQEPPAEGTQPVPVREQTKPEPTIPVAQLYPGGYFPRGEKQTYQYDFNSWRTTSEEKRLAERMQEGTYEMYRHAAEVHRQVRMWAKSWIKPGMKMLDIADRIENKVRNLLGSSKDSPQSGMAFPCGLSTNYIAAHWAPNVGDTTILQEGDVLKVDIGAHIGGRLIDSAFTMSWDPKYDNLLAASREATLAGVKAAGIDVRLCDVGAVIQEVIESYEIQLDGKTIPIKPIRNLSGHSTDVYTVHAGKSVPLVGGGDTTKMEEGEVFAIETFASTGKGLVRDDLETSHYMVSKEANMSQVKSPKAREVLSYLRKTYQTLAFARRWLENGGPERYQLGLKQLVDCGAVNPYPPLVDTKGCYISQFEHSFGLKPSAKEVFSKGEDY